MFFNLTSPKSMLVSACTLATLIATSQSHAQSLLSVYEQALQNDATLLSAEATLGANLEQVTQSRSALLPNISASGNLSYIDTENSDFTNTGLTLSLTQPLFDAGAWFQLERAQALTDAAQLQFEAEQQSLIQRVINAYIQVLVAKNNLDSAQDQEAAIRQRLEKAETELSTGTSQITSVLDAQASLDSARVSTIEAEGALDNALTSLSQLTGKPVHTAKGLAANYPIKLPTPAAAQPWVDKALTENKTVAIAALNTESARLNAKATRANRYPTVALSASHDIDKGTANSDDRSSTSSVALTLSVPLYQGGALSSQSRAAAYGYTAAQFDYDDARRTTKQAVTALLRDLKTSESAIKARKQSILSNQRALLATEEGVVQGNRDLSDVLSVEQQLYAAERDYENARLAHINNLVLFKQQLGTLSPADVAELNRWLNQ